MSTATSTTTQQTTAPGVGDEPAVIAFVERFADAWAAPTPERLNGLVHEDVEFIQPLRPAVNGHDEAAAFWRELFSMIPDLRGEVLSWAHRDGIVFIELRMHGNLAGRPIEWVTLDRIRLREGKVQQRIAYFDPLPLVGAIATRPRALHAWLRANAARLMPRRR